MIASALGFSLFLFVELVCFHGTILFPGLLGISQELGIAIMSVGLLSRALGFFGSSFLSTLRVPDVRFGGIVGAIAFIVGIGLLALIGTANDHAELDFPLLLALLSSGFCIGIGDALINLVWGQRCASVPLRTAYLSVLGCHFAATAIYALTFILSDFDQVAAVIISLIAVAVLLAKIPAAKQPVFTLEGLRASFSALWRPVFGTSVFCFLAGLMPWISGQYDSSIDMMRFASFISTLAILGILAIPTVAVKKPLHLENVYKLILPLVATAFLLLPIIGNGYGGIVNVFAGIGTYAASLILWCLVADATRKSSLSAATVFGFSLGITTSASAIGRLLGYFGGKSLSPGDVGITAISLISLYLLSMLALFIFKRQKSKGSTGAPSLAETSVSAYPGSDALFSENRFAVCATIAEEKGLGKRETEVLTYLAQGCTMLDIAMKLSVSENTARTHIKRVYRKLDVHSKQDIIDMCRERDVSAPQQGKASTYSKT